MSSFQSYIAENPLKDVDGCGGDEIASIHRDAGMKIQKFNNAIKGDDLPIRAYKGFLGEAVLLIEGLMKLKPPQSSMTGRTEENPTMAKILQEIRTIKTTMTQNQCHLEKSGKSWANIARKSETAGATIRIQDENEKKEIAKLSSEELVKRIGRSEIIAARPMLNGQIKVFYTGEEAKQIMESQKDWTQKLASTAHIAASSYQVLIHGMPLSFEPENPDHIKELQLANDKYISGLKIQRATWLKRTKQQGKTAGSLIVWFENADHADKAIAKGIMWRFELRTTEIFRSGFRALQCFNCQRFGHIAKTCTAEAKCGKCSGGHNTRECSGKHEVRCCNCGKKHTAWDQSCPTKIAAKSRAILNRTQDSGRYQTVQEPVSSLESEWQIVASRKRRAGILGPQIVGADGDVIGLRRPGRPRKYPSPVIPSNLFPAKNIFSATVTSQSSPAPECAMSS